MCLLLGACAHVPSGSPDIGRIEPAGAFEAYQAQVPMTRLAASDFRLSGALPWNDHAGSSLLDSRVRLRDHTGLLDISSRFRIDAGDAIDPDQWDAWSRTGGLPASVGTQVSEQRLTARLAEFPVSPLTLGVSQRDESRWLLSHSAETQRRQAELTWAPAPARLRVAWSQMQTDAGPTLLDCSLEGSFALMPEPGTPALKFSGRSCAVFSERSPEVRSVAIWSAAARMPSFGANNEENLVQVRTFSPEFGDATWNDTDMDADAERAYEFRVSHRQRVGAWQARSGVAVHRSAETVAVAAERQWSAEAVLSRQLALLDVAARLHDGVGEDWFLPGGALRSRAVSLDLDLSRWAESTLAWDDVDLSVSWRWSAEELAHEELQELGVQGRLRILW